MTAYSRPAVTVDLKNVIGPGFYDSHRAVREQRAHTLVEEGGRGSLKSSFCSVCLLYTSCRAKEKLVYEGLPRWFCPIYTVEDS